MDYDEDPDPPNREADGWRQHYLDCKKKLDEVKARIVYVEKTCADVLVEKKSQIKFLCEERGRLFRALELYGDHTPTCRKFVAGLVCDCGFDDALKGD